MNPIQRCDRAPEPGHPTGPESPHPVPGDALDDIPTGRHHESDRSPSPEVRTMSHVHPPGLDLDRLRGHLDRERPGLV
ncbi:hypothetical protein GTV15_04590, partial [Streptomyces sp. SID7803]|nr:hypothetical protein [Streptomyces sp. SID7803]